MQIKFSVPTEPRPQPRPRFARGRAYQPKEIVEYKARIKSAATSAMAGAAPMAGELSCRMRFYRRFKPTSRRFGDGDNLFKGVADALNGVVYDDDAQLTRITVEKHCDENQRVEVEFAELVEKC